MMKPIAAGMAALLVAGCASNRLIDLTPKVHSHVQQNADGSRIGYYAEASRNEVMLGAAVEAKGFAYPDNPCGTETWLDFELRRSTERFTDTPNGNSGIGQFCYAATGASCALSFHPVLFPNLAEQAPYKWQVRARTRGFKYDCEGSSRVNCSCQPEGFRSSGWFEFGIPNPTNVAFRTPALWLAVAAAPAAIQNTVGNVQLGDVASLADDDEQRLSIRAVGNPRTASFEAVIPVGTGKRIRSARFSTRVRGDVDCPGSLWIYDPMARTWVSMRSFTVPAANEAHIQNVVPPKALGDYLQNVPGLPAGQAGVSVRLQCQRPGATQYVLSADQLRLDYEVEK